MVTHLANNLCHF